MSFIVSVAGRFWGALGAEFVILGRMWGGGRKIGNCSGYQYVGFSGERELRF